MRIKYLIYCVIASIALCGCRAEKEPERLLLEVDDKLISEIKDFGAYENTETETETETEVITEVEIETEIKAETEPLEEAYTKDYDFSERSILRAVDVLYPEIPSYENEVLYKVEEQVRIQTIAISDKEITIKLYADKKSGSSNNSIEISASSQDDVKRLLLLFENGITEDNVEKFLEGGYNGTENAPLIGLYDADIHTENEVFYVRLVKNTFAEGTTPYWEEASASLSDFLSNSKFDTKIKEGEDTFAEILSGIDFGELTFVSSKISMYGTTKDRNNERLSNYILYQASYINDNGNTYEIKLDYQKENSDKGLTITCYMKDSIPDKVAFEFASHLYKNFYSDSLDEEKGTQNCKFTLNENGFEIHIF